MEARLRRGEIWTASGGPDYAGKPRPFLIVHDHRLGTTGSITVCGFTRDPTPAPVFRVPVAPSERNGLQQPSHVMVDKITTIRIGKVRRRIGRLDDADMLRVERALLTYLGLGA
jgi:mRNA interferase MazF